MSALLELQIWLKLVTGLLLALVVALVALWIFVIGDTIRAVLKVTGWSLWDLVRKAWNR